MFKKLLVFLTVLCLVTPLRAFAAEDVFKINPYGDFLEYPQDGKEVVKILNTDEESFKEYCALSGVKYFAVNKENTKQIKITVSGTEFSKSIINISKLSDGKIRSLLPDIIGIENAEGEIIERDGQKFIKTRFKTKDSGGDFVLTQYITIADKKNIVLSFYTALDQNEDYIYIEKTFDSFSSLYWEKTQENSMYTALILVSTATIVFGIICILTIVTLIIDLVKQRQEATDTETEEISENDK